MAEADGIASSSRNGVCKGDMKTEDPLRVYGVIEGGITCGSLFYLEGSVKGDVHCESIVIERGTIEGNLYVTSMVEIHQAGQVTGHIFCESAAISGLVKGNIEAKTSLSFTAEAKVIGDISTVEIAMHTGSVIHG